MSTWRTYNVLQYLTSDRTPPFWAMPSKMENSSTLTGHRYNRGMHALGVDLEIFYCYWVHESTNPDAERVAEKIIVDGIVRVNNGKKEVIYYVPESVRNGRDAKEFIEVKANKRNRDQVEELIQQKLDDFLYYNSHPVYLRRNKYDENVESVNDRTPELFAQHQKEEIAVFRKYLCPNHNKRSHDHELRIHKDLLLYEEILDLLTKPEFEAQVEKSENTLPEIDISTQKEQIRLLYDLGVFEYLTERYPNTLKGNISQLSHLVASFLKIKYRSVQPTINALMSEHGGQSKNYPSETPKTKAIIDQLKANESI